ncbi:FG-GAP-like repeat-containing protein (plasmid) [Salipiger sp. H15]|uniref:FG-GAP-like repeat-containing protein n=1 Tax=Alloyangia sp. H15 TaxID=3029062 RepID=A0AAU8AR68_9RHOB
MPATSFMASVFDFPDFAFAAPIGPGLTEAETLTIANGYTIAANPHASAESYLQASGASSRAGGIFGGTAGLYDLSLSYFDESDGRSYMEVLVNGAVVAAFDWESASGAAIVTKASAAETTVSGLVLAAGDVIELRGQGDGGEPLRTDAIGIRASATPALGEGFVIEAEDLQILSGFTVAGNGAASGGQTLQHTGGGTARAAYTVQQAGSFDLAIGYFDESDGASSMQVLVNDAVVAEFDWDAATGATIASTQSRASQVIEALDLAAGDVIELRGQGNGGEPLRVDYLEFSAVEGGSGGPVPQVRSLDLAFARDGEMRIALNDGSGHFTEQATGVPSGDGLRILDMDGDGDTDFFSVAITSDVFPAPEYSDLPQEISFELTTTVYENDGTGSFTAHSTTESFGLTLKSYPSGWLEYATQVLEFGTPGDMDGDGDIDLPAFSVAGEAIAMFENDGEGSFTLRLIDLPSGLPEPGYYGNALILADMNGDPLPDLLLSSDYELSATWVLINDGAGGFETAGYMQQSDDGNALETVADLDGDGDNDVMYLAVSEGGGLFSYLNDGTGAQAPGAGPSFYGAESPGFFVVGNFDAEPGLEVVAAGIDDPSQGFEPGLRVFDITGTPDGLGMEIVSFDPAIRGSVREAADFDGDGDLDMLLTTRDASSEVLVLFNDGAANFTAVPAGVAEVPAEVRQFGADVYTGYFDDPMMVA